MFVVFVVFVYFNSAQKVDPHSDSDLQKIYVCVCINIVSNVDSATLPHTSPSFRKLVMR